MDINKAITQFLKQKEQLHLLSAVRQEDIDPGFVQFLALRAGDKANISLKASHEVFILLLEDYYRYIDFAYDDEARHAVLQDIFAIIDVYIRKKYTLEVSYLGERRVPIRILFDTPTAGLKRFNGNMSFPDKLRVRFNKVKPVIEKP